MLFCGIVYVENKEPDVAILANMATSGLILLFIILL